MTKLFALIFSGAKRITYNGRRLLIVGGMSAGYVLNGEAAESGGKANADELLANLAAQGVESDRIMAVDSHGIPIVCGTTAGKMASKAGPATPGPNSLLASGYRGWESIPCVIRRNGIDTFRLEVNVNSAVNAVTMDLDPSLLPDTGGSAQSLRDDGQGGDRVAGDHIWTSVPLRANTGYFFNPTYFGDDTNSPPGLYFFDVGNVHIIELNGTTNGFLIYPEVGFLDPHIPIGATMARSSDVQIMPHLINVRGTNLEAQMFLRSSTIDIETVTARVYAAMPDAYDLLTFFTTDHVEVQPSGASDNFIAGKHTSAKVNYTGTGQGTYDVSYIWGSAGKLIGVNVLDTGDRGTFANNATHELLHQWSAFTDPSLQVADGTGHYNYRAGVGSLVGGAQFIATNGGYFINCNESRSGADTACPMDKYMMGLIDSSGVPPIPVVSSSAPSPFNTCGQVVSSNDIVTTTSISQIQQIHGVRSPGPATSQHDFNLGFVIESNGRLLNGTEMTFYEILARYYTQPWPGAQPPFLGFGWVPITKFFGSGTTWRSYVRSFVQPVMTPVMNVPGGSVAISGTGYPLASYTLQGSSNLTSWTPVTALRAGTNGVFQYTNYVPPTAQFYRAVWNE